MKLLVTCVFFLLASLDCTKLLAQAPSPTIPNFTFYRLDDTPFTKSNLSINTKIIFIFFDTDSKPCQKIAEDLEKNFNEFKLTSLYLISLNNPERIEQFMNKYGKKINDKRNLTLLQDKDKQFINKFSPTKYPAFYIYSAQGNLIQYFAGATKIKELVKAVK